MKLVSGRWLHNWLFTRLSLFKKNYHLIVINLSKQQVLDADLKPKQQICFTGNLEQDRNTTMFFIIEEAKEIVLDFFQRTVRVS